jgi:hypothetical protein
MNSQSPFRLWYKYNCQLAADGLFTEPSFEFPRRALNPVGVNQEQVFQMKGHFRRYEFFQMKRHFNGYILWGIRSTRER